MLIDTHVNLHHHLYDEDREAVIARARAVGVGLMITICDTRENFPAVAAIAHANKDIYASVGAHPHYAKDHLTWSAEQIAEAARDPKVVGIGETGLDFHYNWSPHEDQVAVFKAHVEAARIADLPLIIHTREADALMGDLLAEALAAGPLQILLHCYTSGIDLARRAWALGAYISFSGIMTFKNAHDVRAIALEAPLDRVILETDCPYLAPVPHRGRRSEPAHVADVQAAFCGLRGLDPEEGGRIIEANVHRLFQKIPRRSAQMSFTP
jgi:TatD DNase family protein